MPPPTFWKGSGRKRDGFGDNFEVFLDFLWGSYFGSFAVLIFASFLESRLVSFRIPLGVVLGALWGPNHGPGAPESDFGRGARREVPMSLFLRESDVRGAQSHFSAVRAV